MIKFIYIFIFQFIVTLNFVFGQSAIKIKHELRSINLKSIVICNDTSYLNGFSSDKLNYLILVNRGVYNKVDSFIDHYNTSTGIETSNYVFWSSYSIMKYYKEKSNPILYFALEEYKDVDLFFEELKKSVMTTPGSQELIVTINMVLSKLQLMKLSKPSNVDRTN